MSLQPLLDAPDNVLMGTTQAARTLVEPRDLITRPSDALRHHDAPYRVRGG